MLVHVLPATPTAPPHHSPGRHEPKVRGRSLRPFSSPTVVFPRLGQCCCCFRRRRCCRHCCCCAPPPPPPWIALPGVAVRLGGAAVGRGSVHGFRGWLRCRLLWGRAARAHTCALWSGMQCRSWTAISLAGGWARFWWRWGQVRQKGFPRPSPPDRRWLNGARRLPPQSALWLVSYNPDATLAGETTMSEQ